VIWRTSVRFRTVAGPLILQVPSRQIDADSPISSQGRCELKCHYRSSDDMHRIFPPFRNSAADINILTSNRLHSNVIHRGSPTIYIACLALLTCPISHEHDSSQKRPTNPKPILTTNKSTQRIHNDRRNLPRHFRRPSKDGIPRIAKTPWKNSRRLRSISSQSTGSPLSSRPISCILIKM
jgi:hypothetical protein